MTYTLHTAFEDLSGLIFPNFCLHCKTGLVSGEQYLCSYCIKDLPITNYHLEKENPLMTRFYGKVKLSYALAYVKFIKSGAVQPLLHHLKYLNKPEIGEQFGHWYGAQLLDAKFQSEFDLIVPVPLHFSKLRLRGYNQCDGFAKGLSDVLSIPWSDKAVARVKKSETQTKKNRLDRWRNVENIFDVIDVAVISDKRILLVDDVITTGSTLESCALSLLGTGKAASVSIATIAVAQ